MDEDSRAALLYAIVEEQTNSTKTMLDDLAVKIEALNTIQKTAGVAVVQKTSDALTSFSRRWPLVVGASTVIIFLVAILGAWLVSMYERSQIEDLSTQKSVLESEISVMQVQADTLARKGGRIRLSTCGPKSRLCAEVSRDQGGGIHDFTGPWSIDNGPTYVILKGY